MADGNHTAQTYLDTAGSPAPAGERWRPANDQTVILVSCHTRVCISTVPMERGQARRSCCGCFLFGDLKHHPGRIGIPVVLRMACRAYPLPIGKGKPFFHLQDIAACAAGLAGKPGRTWTNSFPYASAL